LKTIKQQYTKKDVRAENLDIRDMFDHFKTLLNSPNNQRPENTEENSDFILDEDLDSDFTEAEIKAAIFHQKIIKAAA
jgi:hypothetical protein